MFMFDQTNGKKTTLKDEIKKYKCALIVNIASKDVHANQNF